jgi:ribosomal protein S12 methylthiotransferase
LPDAVPEEIKEERRARFMAVQADISTARLQRKIGTIQQVLVDSVQADGALARSSADAPEIDGIVYIEDGAALTPGEFCAVRITAADTHDLRGVLTAK